MKRKTIPLCVLGCFTIFTLVVTACMSVGMSMSEPRERVRVATTTSLYDTGLWGYLEPKFEKRYRAELDILSVGTGIALEYGKRGDVDALAIHDRDRELQFVAEGWGVERVPFAYSYFVIVGPPEDPAGIKGLSPEDAFRKLWENRREKFLSRGDESGTHAKEKAIWKTLGFDYEKVRRSGNWYIEAGRGMGSTLLMASELAAYTLTDTGTFLAYKGKLNLVPLVERGQLLLNVYSVIAVNPNKHPEANIEMADKLIDFLTSPQIQELISSYGIKDYGVPSFYPCAGSEPRH